MVNLNQVGCEFGRVMKVNFDNFEGNVNKRFDGIENSLSDIKQQNIELFNHQSSRWPKGAVWAMGILTAIASAALTTWIINTMS